MSEKLTMEEWHKKQAVENFNGTWDLLDKSERSPEEDREMIHRAHASRFHWGVIGDNPQFATGEWQISRVYATLTMGESALFHGKASLDYCEKGGLTAFDYGFAYEAIARAYGLLEEETNKEKFLNKAKDAATGIEDKDNREYFLSELKTL